MGPLCAPEDARLAGRHEDYPKGRVIMTGAHDLVSLCVATSYRFTAYKEHYVKLPIWQETPLWGPLAGAAASAGT